MAHIGKKHAASQDHHDKSNTVPPTTNPVGAKGPLTHDKGKFLNPGEMRTVALNGELHY